MWLKYKIINDYKKDVVILLLAKDRNNDEFLREKFKSDIEIVSCEDLSVDEVDDLALNTLTYVTDLEYAEEEYRRYDEVIKESQRTVTKYNALSNRILHAMEHNMTNEEYLVIGSHLFRKSNGEVYIVSNKARTVEQRNPDNS